MGSQGPREGRPRKYRRNERRKKSIFAARLTCYCYCVLYNSEQMRTLRNESKCKNGGEKQRLIGASAHLRMPLCAGEGVVDRLDGAHVMLHAHY